MTSVDTKGANRSTRTPVYITGIGTMLPGASNANEFWWNLYEGKSQIDFLTRYDPSGLPVRVAAEITSFDHRKHLPNLDERFAAKYTREILIVMSAVEQALVNAGVERQGVDPRRIGLVSSSSRGPLSWWEAAFQDEHGVLDRDPDGDAPATFGDSGAMLRSLPGCPSTMAAIYSDIQGLVTTISNACVGGHQAIGLAMQQLQGGDADMMLVCGHDFPIMRSIARVYLALGKGVLTRESRDPVRAMKPYTIHRDGFAFGEGAVTLCLETERSMLARGAVPIARVLSARTTNEADHPTTMDLSGHRTAGLIRSVLADAGRGPREVGYFCGHGTATGYNDIAESRALGSLYDGLPRGKWPPISGNKPIYGHCMGISGVVNVAATALMLQNQQLCPTINFSDPDPECDHDHVGEGGRAADFDLAVSLSFAFGSQTAVVALGSP